MESQRMPLVGSKSDRYFFNDYDFKYGANLLRNDSKGCKQEFRAQIMHYISEHISTITDRRYFSDNQSIYTGAPGVAFALYYVGRSCEEFRKYRELAPIFLEANTHRTMKSFGFLTGETGRLIVQTMLNNFGDLDQLLVNIKEIIDQHESNLPSEIMNGLAGIALGLLYLRPFCLNSKQTPKIDIMLRYLFELLIARGVRFSKENGHRLIRHGIESPPLLYSWHDKIYYGFAHGITGILFVLLRIVEVLSDLKSGSLENLIMPTLMFLTTQTKPESRNMFSSAGSDNDRLVQWCHGSPALIFLLIKASNVIDDNLVSKELLIKAEYMADGVWEKGLLVKGCGLCHGVAGNGYVFLELAKLTNDRKWLERALCFADFCVNRSSFLIRKPDRPNSLFEGLAGTLVFLTDIANFQFNGFPFHESPIFPTEVNKDNSGDN